MAVNGVIELMVVIVACGGIGAMLGWFVSRGYRAFGAIIRGQDDAAFYQEMMPWPHGVQEEDEVHWQIPRTVSRSPTRASNGGRPLPPHRRTDVPPTRPQAPAGHTS